MDSDTKGLELSSPKKYGAEGSRHTLNHTDCPVCKRAALRASRTLCMSAMDLEEAGELWLSGKIDCRRKPRTLEANRGYLKHLKEFFGEIQLQDIHAGSFLAYQSERSKTAGVSAINHELNALAQMLRRAGLWEKIRYHYAPLKEKEWQKPKTYTAAEEQRIFAYAKDDPNLEVFELVATITRYTSASGSELRLMQLRNIFVNCERPRIDITGDTTKNDIRPRTIPLIPEAEQAFKRALDRAYRLGCHYPEHYLFPLRVNPARYNPQKPASRSWLRKQTVKIRERTGIAHVRPHAFRHLIVTEMLEKGVPPETVKGVCGWVSEKMIEVYCHTRYEAKAEALSATVAPTKAAIHAHPSGLYLISTHK